MKTEDIIAMAKKAGFVHVKGDIGLTHGLTRFAQLVRNAALEEAAKVCEKWVDRYSRMKEEA